MPRRPVDVESEDNLTYRQVEEFVSGVQRRIPGLKTLTIEVNEDGTVSFEFAVLRSGKGRV